MNIANKIEEIRKKPEHIRMRYVWFFVTLSMLFVIILWIFSLKTLKSESQSESIEDAFPGSTILNEFSQEQKTLDEARKNAGNSLFNNNDATGSDAQKDETQDNQDQKNLNEEGQ